MSKEGQVPVVVSGVVGPAAPTVVVQGGVAQPVDDYRYHSTVVASAVSPTPESPEKAAARAAENEETAERAMEEAVRKAQQEERAAMYAAKKAQSLRAAAERAAAAENAAAVSEIAAADSEENEAVRRATSERNRAKVAAVKAAMQKATAFQAFADQQAAAQRAAASRTAAETARGGLHHFGEDEGDELDDRLHDYEKDRDNDARRGFRDRHADDDLPFDDDDDYDDDVPPWRRHRRHCGTFSCPDSFRRCLNPETVFCDGRRGCTQELCCMRSSCQEFACTPPLTLRLTPETLMCEETGCVEDRCCLGGMGAGMVYGCNIGDAVTATWQGDGRQYRAEVATINADGTITVTWMDGDNGYPVIAADQVFKNGVPCTSGAVGAGGMVGGVVPAVVPGAVMPAVVPAPAPQKGFWHQVFGR